MTASRRLKRRCGTKILAVGSLSQRITITANRRLQRRGRYFLNANARLKPSVLSGHWCLESQAVKSVSLVESFYRLAFAPESWWGVLGEAVARSSRSVARPDEAAMAMGFAC